MKNLKNHKIIKWTLLLFRIIIITIIAFIVGIIVIQRVFNNNISIGGYRIFTIITESMVPKYKVHDVVISKTTEANKIKIGDDLVYLGKEGDFNGKIITHQVIGIEENNGYIFRTKGIANTGEDPLVKEDQVYGIVVKKSVILSTISKAVNNPFGFYFLILIPLAILIVLEIIDRVKEKEIEE